MSYRRSVNKKAGAGKFRRQVGRTRAANVAPPPQRGRYRL